MGLTHRARIDLRAGAKTGRMERHGRRFLLIAVVLSVVVHLAAAVLIVLLPRLVPREGQPHEEGAVELLMIEQKGAKPDQAGQPKDDTSVPRPSEKKAVPEVKESKNEVVTPRSAEVLAPSPPSEQTEPRTAEADRSPGEKAANADPAPPHSQEGPVFDLEGTDSESNAIVLGGRVLPAMKDDKFRNRPPAYPVEAEIRGEHGSVLILIHISENGVATGADVTESSGYDVLDQAAILAVRKWHFHPALRQGHPIPFDMPFRITFQPN
jgi:protein TonB